MVGPYYRIQPGLYAGLSGFAGDGNPQYPPPAGQDRRRAAETADRADGLSGGWQMNWIRIILDGLAMAAYFNLFAAAVALYKPRLMFPCYPSAIIKAAKEPPTKREAAGYWRWIILWEWLPLLLYGALSAVAGGTHGFWRLALTGYIQWMMVNLGDLFFLDVWLIQKKTKNRFVISGTEGHPGYEFKAWMKDYALPEHLLQWPLFASHKQLCAKSYC